MLRSFYVEELPKLVTDAKQALHFSKQAMDIMLFGKFRLPKRCVKKYIKKTSFSSIKLKCVYKSIQEEKKKS